MKLALEECLDWAIVLDRTLERAHTQVPPHALVMSGDLLIEILHAIRTPSDTPIRSTARATALAKEALWHARRGHRTAARAYSAIAGVRILAAEAAS